MKYVILVLFSFLLSACSHDYRDLESELPAIEQLAPLAELVESHGVGAIIDLRDEPIRIEPSTLSAQVSEKWLTELTQNNIELVTYNSSFGGTLFVKEVYGISISGSASGWVHLAEKGTAARVSNIEKYAQKVQEEKNSSAEADNLMVVKPINEHWGIFLHTF